MSGEDTYIKPKQGKGCTANWDGERGVAKGAAVGSSNGPVYDIVLGCCHVLLPAAWVFAVGGRA